jgi:hypothetical protein
MKTSFVFAGIILIATAFSASTLPIDPHSTSFSQTSSFVPKSTAKVVFVTRVDQLRMRTNPDLNAPVVKELPEQSYVKYLHETGGPLTEVTLRGVKHRGHWYKVVWPHSEYSKENPVQGWVFSGGVALSSVEFSGDLATQLNFDFLKATKITQAQFDAQAALFKNNFVDDTQKYPSQKDVVKLPLDNGQVKLIGNAPCKNQPEKEVDMHHYQGQFPELGLYLISTECAHFELISSWNYLIRKSDGQIVLTDLETATPMISPDGQNLASAFSGDCGGVLGIDFFHLRNNLWAGYTLISDDGWSADQVIWSQDSRQCLVKWEVLDDEGEEMATHYCSFSFAPQL